MACFLFGVALILLAVYFSAKYGVENTVDFIKSSSRLIQVRWLSGILIVSLFLTCIQSDQNDKVSSKNDRLATQNKELQSTVENLRSQLTQTESEKNLLVQVKSDQVSFAIAERDSIKAALEAYMTSDEGLWKSALNTGSIADYRKLVSWYPESPYASMASQKIDVAINSVRQEFKVLKESLKTYDDPAMTAQTISNFKSLAEIDSLTVTQCDALLKYYSDLAAKKEIQMQKEEAAIQMEKKYGIQLKILDARWKVGEISNSLMLIPFVKAKIKNISGSPIQSLRLTISFSDTDKKEEFGNDSKYIASSFDPPFQNEFTKEVEFVSSVGFDLTGIGTIVLENPEIYKKIPNLQAFVYLSQISEGNILLTTVDIPKKFKLR